MFPDHWEAFEDLANMDKDEVPGQEMDIDDPTSPSSKIVSDSEAATVSAQSLLEGKILHEIVFLHLKVYAVLTGKQMEHFDVDEAFKEQHNLGRALLASMGGAVPRSLDDATMSGEWQGTLFRRTASALHVICTSPLSDFQFLSFLNQSVFWHSFACEFDPCSNLQKWPL